MSDLKFGLNQPRTIRHHAHSQTTIPRRITLNSDAVIRDGHLECGRRFIALLEDAMQRAREVEQLPRGACPRQAAVGLIALLDGLVVNWTLEPALFPLAEYAPGLVDAYLLGLCASGGR